MNLISAEKISRSVAEKWLFQNITFGLNEGDRVALVGINGTGKTTLLRVLSGLDKPDGGVVSTRKDISVGYLLQAPAFDETQNVLDNVLSGNSEIIKLLHDYEKIIHKSDEKELASDRFHDLVEKLNALDAWNYEREVKEILGKLGLQEHLETPVNLLSGGQRRRAAMAKLLIAKPDVLILDEPTNHLDLETIEWLEDLIGTNFKTLLMVTHDRYFLDRVCNQIVELEAGNLSRYKGNYAYYLEKKEERQEIEKAETSRARNLYRRELEWIRRQPKARGTKSRARVDAFDDVKEKATNKNQDVTLDLPFKASRQGNKILEIRKIGKAYGENKLIRDFTYYFQKREKVGLIGKNGAGKTTLLRILTGQELPDKGEIVVGETTTIGYFTQDDVVFDPEKKLIDCIKEVAEVVELANGVTFSASQFLMYFQFPSGMHFTPVGKLSGGEKKRIHLIRVLMKNPNFLILDEPTNDLDINTLNILEDFLFKFEGTLLIVSHDRYFMDRLVDHIFIFEGNGEISDFPGNYTDYRESVAENSGKSSKKQIDLVQKETKGIQNGQNIGFQQERKKISYKEQKELEELEKHLEKLETDKNAILERLNDAGIPHSELLKLTVEFQAIDAQIDTFTSRWIELSDML